MFEPIRVCQSISDGTRKNFHRRYAQTASPAGENMRVPMQRPRFPAGSSFRVSDWLCSGDELGTRASSVVTPRR
jgi:hypothetical protein